MTTARGIRLGGVAALVALAMVATTTNATDWCDGNGPVIDLAGQAYLAVDCPLSFGWCDSHILFWTYVEANGVEGLQRGGESLLGDADVCQDYPDPDLLVF